MCKKLTIFTPTYNRGYVLHKAYKSLCRQTNKNFIWLIVDDGSTDNTKEIIKNWKIENKIEIKYVYQENRGKQMATNLAINECSTEFFADLDSDDYYKSSTVEKMLSLINIIEDDYEICGIIGRKINENGKLIGNSSIREKIVVDNYCNLVRKYNYYGDTTRVYRTNILKEYLYPNLDEKFIPENVMFDSIDKKYKMIFVNQPFTVCEYISDGYTKNSKKLFKQNPKGILLSLNKTIDNNYPLKQKFKCSILYTIWGWKYKIKNCYKNSCNKSLYIMTLPFSILLYILKKPKWCFEDN